MSDEEKSDQVSRVIIFGGKAAPGYYIAKMIIKLINSVAEKVNNDPDVSGLLNVVFVPDYNVSLAELLMPASEISQHISTAGMEASGTGNMKFTMNGGLILGTMDGANVELCEHIGEDNMFIFGTRAEDVDKMRDLVKDKKYPVSDSLTQVIQLLKDGYVGVFNELQDLINSFTINDWYLVSVDWDEYLEAQEKVDMAYKDQDKWTIMSIHSTAGTGFFSSDRSIKDYADKIWDITPHRRPGPIQVDIEKVSQYIDLPMYGNNLSTSVGPSLSVSASPGVSLERLMGNEDEGFVIKSCSPSPYRPRSNQNFI